MSDQELFIDLVKVMTFTNDSLAIRAKTLTAAVRFTQTDFFDQQIKSYRILARRDPVLQFAMVFVTHLIIEKGTVITPVLKEVKNWIDQFHCDNVT